MAAGTGEEKGNEDETSEMKRDEAPYEFSLDPDTKAAEKKLRRVVAKQVRQVSRNSVQPLSRST